jgi:hypothetical protein
MADILRNDFKPFAVSPDSEVLSQYQWDEGTLRKRGHVPGLASQYLANRAERQGTLAASAIGVLINRAGLNAIDDGDHEQLANAFQAAVVFLAQEMLFSLLDATAENNESVLVGYDPITKTLFGYPLGRLIVRSEHLRGGNPAMEADGYPDGSLYGGDPTMAAEGYADGNLFGGDPYTY